MRTSLWVMSGMASRPLTSRMSLSAVMFMPRKNVVTVLPDSIAAVGFAANSYNFHGTITDAYDLGCELQKKRIECAIMIKAAEADMADDAQ